MTVAYPPPPAELDWITKVIGADATLALVREFGGTRLYIPVKALAGGDLTRAIGLPAAQAAARSWGADRLEIPLARQWQANCLKAEGRTKRQIARELRISQSTVVDLLRGRRQTRDSREVRGLPPVALQLDLFEDVT